MTTFVIPSEARHRAYAMERPAFSMLQHAVGGQLSQGRERLQLQHGGVGEHFGIAAQVGIRGVGVVGVAFYKKRLAAPVRHPAQRVAHADLEGLWDGGVLAHLNQPFTEAQARVTHVGIRP